MRLGVAAKGYFDEQLHQFAGGSVPRHDVTERPVSIAALEVMFKDIRSFQHTARIHTPLDARESDLGRPGSRVDCYHYAGIIPFVSADCSLARVLLRSCIFQAVFLPVSTPRGCSQCIIAVGSGTTWPVGLMTTTTSMKTR